MWPGIKIITPDTFGQNDIAVVYAKNQIGVEEQYVPIAVGKMLTNKVPEQLKGRAIQIEHYIYDELWNTGPKKIPESI